MKKQTAKVLCFILSFAMLICVLAPVYASADTLSGDVNSDGSITVADARTILRIAIGLAKAPSGADIDMNCDNRINVLDARTALRIANGLEKASGTIKLTAGSTDGTPLTAAQVNAAAEKFTVEISVEGPGYTATGTGFFISSDGKIATNFHVVENATKITVSEISGETYDCQSILAYDDENDFAVIKVDTEDHDFARVSTSYSTGDKIYTLGSSQGLSFTFSSGMISNAKRELTDYNPGFYYIQIDAPISSGNSGGPLLDEHANVIGINSLSLEEGQNLNFSIPVINLTKLDTQMSVSAETYYKENTNGVYASALKLKEACVNYGSSGTTNGIKYYTINSTGIRNYYSLTYYYDYDVLEVSYTSQYGSFISGTTMTQDGIIIGSKSVFEGYCISQKSSSSSYIINAEYTIDGSTFKSGSTVTYESNDGTETNVSTYEKNSATAVAGMVSFLKTVISTYNLDITVKNLGFKNF